MKKILLLCIASLLFISMEGKAVKKEMVNVKDFGAIGDGLFL